MDLALDTLTGDLALDDGGQAHLTVDDERIAQRLRIRLRFLRGEDVLDDNNGIPWFELLERKDGRTRVENAVRRAIETSEGVASIAEFNFSVDSRREASCSFSVLMVTGEIVAVPEFSLTEF